MALRRMGNRQALLEEEEVENILVRPGFKKQKTKLEKRDLMVNILGRPGFIKTYRCVYYSVILLHTTIGFYESLL